MKYNDRERIWRAMAVALAKDGWQETGVETARKLAGPSDAVAVWLTDAVGAHSSAFRVHHAQLTTETRLGDASRGPPFDGHVRDAIVVAGVVSLLGDENADLEDAWDTLVTMLVAQRWSESAGDDPEIVSPAGAVRMRPGDLSAKDRAATARELSTRLNHPATSTAQATDLLIALGALAALPSLQFKASDG